MRDWRRTACGVLAGVLVAGLILAFVPGHARAAEVVLLEEDFDSIDAGAWPAGFYQFEYTSEHYPGTHVVDSVSPDPPSPSNCLLATNISAPGTDEITVPLFFNAANCDSLTVEAAMMLPSAYTRQDVQLALCKSPASRSSFCTAGLHAIGATLYVDAMDGASYRHLTTVNYDEWVKVREVIDLRAMTYDVYVNDVKVNGAALAMATADPSDIGALLLWVGYEDIGHAYYDDIRVAATVPLDGSWLAVNTFTMRGSRTLSPESDSFTVAGTFNLQPGALDPSTSDVTLSIGDWSVTIPAASWTTRGPGKPWLARVDDGKIRGQITYWLRNSSKCAFRFTGGKQTIRDGVRSFPDVPVRLRIGGVFDETLIAVLAGTLTSARMVGIAPEPAFVLNSVTIRTSPVAARDSVVIAGRLDVGAGAFDPAVHGIIIGVQGETVEVHAGGLPPLKGARLTCRKQFQGSQKLSLAADLKTGKTTLILTGFDLDPIANPADVSLQITNMPGAAWASRVWMTSDAKSVRFTY